MNTQTKGALRSKAFWGALITVVSMLGVLPFGLTFDPETGNATINVYDVFAAMSGVGVFGGAVLGWIGRLTATKTIRGLW